MKVAGLNNLGFSSSASAAAVGKTAQGKGKSSFESVLDQTQNAKSPVTAARGEDPAKQQQRENDKPAKEQEQTPTPKAQPKAESKVQQKSETKVQATGIKSASSVNAPVMHADPSPKSTENIGPSEDEMSSQENADALPSAASSPGLTAPSFNDRPAGATAGQAVAANIAKPAAIVGQDDPNNTLTRRVVWNDFLRKMGDLGISADDVLQAFGSLSKEELAQPPEQSVDKVVMALGLDGQQAFLAKQYFTELIQKTKSKSLGEELQASHKQLSLALLSQRDVQRKALQKSLENMDRSFFMNRMAVQNPQAQGPQDIAEPREVSALKPGMTSEVAEQDLTRETSKGAMPFAPLAIPGLNTVTPQAAAAPEVGALTSAAKPEEINKLVGQMKAPTTADKKSVDELIRNFNSSAAASAAPEVSSAPATARMMAAAPALAGMPAAQPVIVEGTPAAATPTSATQAHSAAMSGFASGIFASTKGGGKDAGADNSGEDSNSASYMTGAVVGENRMNSTAAKGEFQTQMAQQPQQTMAVPDMVQQAHVMVREGGGDMKVTLHPEGLGEVAMRVSVDNGKVSVQMITESDEAKKLIERQIGDLKSGLAANHLQVESIKVDTASNLGRQLEQQYQDAQRQQTQANWEQFRQDHQGWRRSFFDTGSVNPYASQGEAPRDVSAPSAKSKAATSRRLDLVA